MALFGKKNKTVEPANDNGVLDTDTDAFAPADIPNVSEDELYAAASGRGKKSGRAAKVAPRGIKGGSVVGLNIGNESIKAVELRGKGTDVAVTAVGTIPTPPESVSNGVVLSPVALASAIRDLLTQSGIKTRNVISSVSGSGALVVRVLEMPRMSDADLAENMNTDLERYVPFPPTEVVKDFRALRELPSDPDAPNMEVLLAAAQNEVIDQHLQVLNDAKVQPQAIDVEPLAAARAVIFDPAKDNGSESSPFVDYNEATAVVNIGATGTEISVLRGDILVFTRTVPVGGNALTQTISDTLGLAWPDAEKLKFDMGDALPPHSNANATTDDWSEFGETNDADAAAGASSAADPFESSFFSAGPQGQDPQEQHQQKQDGDESSPGFDLSRFNFTDEEDVEIDDDIPTAHPEDHPDVKETRVTGDITTPVVAEAVPSASHDGDDLSNLPSVSTEVVPSTLPSVTASADTSSTDNLPSMAASESGSPPVSVPVIPAGAVTSDPFVAGSDVDESELNLPSVIDFPTVAETVGDIPAVAPSGQMYGMNSVDDPSLPSFPSLPNFPGMMGPGQEDVPYEDISNLPTMSDDDTGAGPVAGAGNLSFETATPVESSNLPSVGVTPASVPTESVFDFSAPLEPVAGTGAVAGVSDDAFDLAFADMIAPPTGAGTAGAGTTVPGAAPPDTGAPGATSTVVTPGAVPSPYEIDASAAGATSDFDLDQFVAPAGADDADGFSMEDFGLLAGEGTITPQRVYEVLQPRLAELVGEIRRSLEYYQSRYPDTTVRRVVLVGGGARLSNIDAMLTQELGIPALVDNPLSRLPLRVESLTPNFIDTYGSTFAVAVGLAMRDLVA